MKNKGDYIDVKYIPKVTEKGQILRMFKKDLTKKTIITRNLLIFTLKSRNFV
jgi:hypothetical protein